MTRIDAPCSRELFPAYHHSGTRDESDVRLVVLHDEEASTARSAASYFRSASSGGSAHLCVDDTDCFRCLEDTQIPWGAISADAISANLHGFHIEQAGFAAWKFWLWRKHLRTLERAAFKTAGHCKRFGITARFLTAADLVANPAARGITTHREISAASRRLDPAHSSWYSHSDPGLFWPRMLFMRYVRRYMLA